MMSVGPVEESLVWAEELLSAGEDLADEELLLVGAHGGNGDQLLAG